MAMIGHWPRLPIMRSNCGRGGATVRIAATKFIGAAQTARTVGCARNAAASRNVDNAVKCANRGSKNQADSAVGTGKYGKMSTLNLTQHVATPQQIADGVVEPSDETKQRIKALLTFEEIPKCDEVERRANELASIAKASGHANALIGGAPWFMAPLERALVYAGIMPVYSFSQRRSIERIDDAGKVIKSTEFVHIGFIPVWGTFQRGR